MTALAKAVYPWSDTITILQACGGKRMAKVIQPDGTFFDYDDAYRYNASTLHLNGPDDIWTLLEKLIGQPDRCVVRGELIGSSSARGIRRLAYLDQKTGDEPTLADVPRSWLALDADHIERPEHIPATDLLRCADVVTDLLPPAFTDATCFVQASAGHGIKPGIRLRLWYWCWRAITGAELKRWLAQAPVDKSVFNPVQPIYTAAPVMAPGVKDHLPYRLAELPGSGWLHVPSAEELAPSPRPPAEAVRPVCVAGSARARLYVEGALTNAHNRISTATQRHPVILSEACGLARFVKAGLLTESQLHSTLWAAAQQAGKDDEAEIGRMVAFGMAHPDTTELPVDLRYA